MKIKTQVKSGTYLTLSVGKGPGAIIVSPGSTAGTANPANTTAASG